VSFRSFRKSNCEKSRRSPCTTGRGTTRNAQPRSSRLGGLISDSRLRQGTPGLLQADAAEVPGFLGVAALALRTAALGDGRAVGPLPPLITFPVLRLGLHGRTVSVARSRPGVLENAHYALTHAGNQSDLGPNLRRGLRPSTTAARGVPSFLPVPAASHTLPPGTHTPGSRPGALRLSRAGSVENPSTRGRDTIVRDGAAGFPASAVRGRLE